MLTVSLSAILLSLGCGIGFAGADYFRKAVPATCPNPLVLFYFIGGQIPILALVVALSDDVRMTSGYWLPGVVDVALGIGANLMFVAAVRRSPLSMMIPLLALVPVLTTLAAAVVLGEIPSLRQLSGTGLIVIGLFALYMPQGEGVSPTASWTALRREPGVQPMLLTIVGWSLTPVFDKLCINASSVSMHGLIQVTAICAISGVWVITSYGLRGLLPPPGSKLPLLGSAISAGLGYGLQLAAYQTTMVAVVEGLKRVTGLLAALVVGRIMFAEPITKSKIVGVGILAIGVPLILFG
jgi:drug/metabolite transporter (DMT)-like permease